MKDVITVLSSARDLLAQPKGYLKGRRQDGEGGYCALGAIDQAMANRAQDGMRGECGLAIVALDDAIPAGTKQQHLDGIIRDPYNCHSPQHRQSRIACYNNTTDQQTVVEWFDRAIQIQREHPMEKL